MDFNIVTHKELTGGYAIKKVKGETPMALRGFYSTEQKAKEAVDKYNVIVEAKKVELEEKIKVEKEKAEANKKKAPKKTTKKKTDK